MSATVSHTLNYDKKNRQKKQKNENNKSNTDIILQRISNKKKLCKFVINFYFKWMERTNPCVFGAVNKQCIQNIQLN